MPASNTAATQLKHADLTKRPWEGTAKAMRILVIEDDKDAASWLVKGLKESGHVVDLANDGEQGLGLASDGGYDVLIVDRMLPKLDGLAVIKGLRGADNKVPILILSALSDVDERVKGLRAGGDDYLAKPYSFAELLARVEGLGARKLLDPKDAKLRELKTVSDRQLTQPTLMQPTSSAYT